MLKYVPKMVWKAKTAFSPSNSKAKPMLPALKIIPPITKLGVPQKWIPLAQSLMENGEIVILVALKQILMNIANNHSFSMKMEDASKDLWWNQNYNCRSICTKLMIIMVRIIMLLQNVLSPDLPRNVCAT